MLKCITFDVTNTLIKVSGSVGYQYSRILNEKFSYKLDEELTNSNFKKYFIEQNKKLPGFGYNYGKTNDEMIKNQRICIFVFLYP